MSTDRGPRKILIVEDEGNFGAVLQKRLEREGFRAILASSAEEAYPLVVAGVGQERPDLLLLDVLLPGEDGFAFCLRLRKEGIRIPVLMMTGMRRDQLDRQMGRNCGADGYFVKPFSFDDLLAGVNAILAPA